MPLVSIGLPVYNGEKYLSEAIESILGQTFTDFELIISDNASRDRTAGICAAYERQDPRVRYHRRSRNIGAAGNFNKTFALARGKYFKWASYDDVCDAGFLAACIEVLEKDPSVVLAYPRTRVIDAGGKVIADYEDGLDFSSADRCERFRLLIRSDYHCYEVFGLMRSEVLRKTRLIGGFISSDRALLAELGLLGRFFEVPEHLFLRRDHGETTMRTYSIYSEGLAEWFDANKKGRFHFSRTRLFVEHLRSVGRSPISFADKLRCYEIMRKDWLSKYWRHMGGECKIFLRRKLGLKGAGTA